MLKRDYVQTGYRRENVSCKYPCIKTTTRTVYVYCDRTAPRTDVQLARIRHKLRELRKSLAGYAERRDFVNAPVWALSALSIMDSTWDPDGIPVFDWDAPCPPLLRLD